MPRLARARPFRFASAVVVTTSGTILSLFGLGGVVTALRGDTRLLSLLLASNSPEDSFVALKSVPLALIGHHSYALFCWGALLAVLGAFGCAGHRFAYWAALSAFVAFEIGFFLFVAFPGIATPALTAPGPVLLITALAFCLLDARRARRS